MRSAGNFNPEWGYLAPAPSIFRTARVVIVAAAVGATAAAGVVLALVERPAAKMEAASAHALVRATPALPTQELQQPASVVAVPPPVAATAAVQVSVPQVSVPQASVPQISIPAAAPVQNSATDPEPAAAPVLAPAQPSAPALSVVESSSHSDAPSGTAETSPAVAAAPPSATAEQSPIIAVSPEPPPATTATVETDKKPAKKHQASSANAKSRHDDGLARTLRHFFTAGGGTAYGQGRGLY